MVDATLVPRFSGFQAPSQLLLHTVQKKGRESARFHHVRDDVWFWIIKLLPTHNYLGEFNSAGDESPC